MLRPLTFVAGMLVYACTTDSESNSETRDPSMEGPRDSGPDEPPDAGSSVTDAGDDRDAGTIPGSDDDAGSTDTPSLTDMALERMVRDKLNTCGVIDRLAIGHANLGSVIDEYDRCTARCIIEASCADVFTAYCGDTSADRGVAACTANCDTSPVDGFACADGTMIPQSFYCDLREDCAGGEDEGVERCGSFGCNTGPEVPSEDIWCDNVPDCEDGSDENGCIFVCQAPSD
jgi:hypothetical protein